MSKIYTVFFSVLVFLVSGIYDTSAQTYFQKVYQSAPYNQEGQDVLPTPDGGYLIAGYTNNSIQYDCDILLIKTNAFGDEQWRKTYGGNKPDFPNHMLDTYDGNYFLIGYSMSYSGGDADIFLMKINSAGTVLWQKTYGGWGNDFGHDIIKTGDGNYLIVGSSNSQGFADQNANLIKINPSGAVIWNKMYGGNADDFGNCVRQATDGGYIMIGETFSFGAPGGDAYVVKVNVNGDTTWTKRYGGAYNDEGFYMTVSGDGGYVFLIRDSSNVNRDVDIRMIKTDEGGNIIWNKVYGGSLKDTPKMIQRTSDGGYIVGGHSRSFGWIEPDMWILKCNSSGDTLWTRHYGGNHHEHCYVIRELHDGSFIAVGKTSSFGPDFDPIFLKINSYGTMVLDVADHYVNEEGLKLFPNPAVRFLQVDMNGLNADKVEVRDLEGRIVHSNELNQEERFMISLENNAPGIYFVTCYSSVGPLTRKIILE